MLMYRGLLELHLNHMAFNRHSFFTFPTEIVGHRENLTNESRRIRSSFLLHVIAGTTS